MTQKQFTRYAYRHSERMIFHVGHNSGDVECMLVGIDFDHETFNLVPFDQGLYGDKVYTIPYKFVDKPPRKPRLKLIKPTHNP